MASRRTWKDAALASALTFALLPLGCSETPPPASPTPAPAPAEEAPTKAKAGKGKKKDPNLDIGIAELREQRRKAEAAKAP